MNPRTNRPLGVALVAMLAMVLSSHREARAADYLVNTDTLTITRNGAAWDFGGQLNAAMVSGGKATFYIGGDLTLNAGDTLRGIGSRVASFQIGNDLAVSPGAAIDFSAIGTTAGAGGGSSGGGGLGQGGGLGGDGGNGGRVQWVRGGGAMIFFIPGAVPPPVPGLWGRTGQSGDDGDHGFAGLEGGQGGVGFGNLASQADGGDGGFDANKTGFGGYGGAGGDMAVYWPSPLPSFIPGVPTKDGGDGYTGGDGYQGQTGADGESGHGGAFAADPNSFDLVAGNGGGGGGGGQGGAGGGGAGGGGGGAAGQGNWAKSFGFAGFNIASTGGSGGPGSDGGDGGLGGAGGIGGDGGAGGGAAEFNVQGQVTLNGGAQAKGGDGQTGTGGNTGFAADGPGTYPTAANIAAIIPIPGVTTVPFLPPPPVPIPDPFLAGFGGIGGVGGYGGQGGTGGDGGTGGGGSGGTVKFVGSHLTGVGSVNLSGGLGHVAGQTYDDGEAGQLLVGTNTLAAGSSAVWAFGGGVSLNGNDTLSRIGTQAVNPFVAGSPSVPTVIGLNGGAEAFGMTNLNPLDVLIDNPANDDPPPSLVTGASQEANAFAGIALFDVGPGDFTPADLGFNEDYLGYDMLLFFTAKGSPIDNPMLGVGQEDYLLPLLAGGWANDPLFGGVADTELGTMLGFTTYATLIPEGSEWFNFSVESGGLILSEKLQTLDFGVPVYLTSSPDVPVLDAMWNTGNGNWSNAANWDLTFAETGLPPDGSEDPAVPGIPSNVASYAYNIFVQNSAMVDADIVVTVDQLNIGAADSLTIMPGKSLTVERFAVRTDSGRVNNDGEIYVDGASFFISGQGLLLQGTGTLRTSNSQANTIAGLRDTDTLVQAGGHTIEASGKLGNNALVVTNQGHITTAGVLTVDPTGNAQRNMAAFRNSGVVAANSGGRQLHLNDGFFHNESAGLMEATGGAQLHFHDARVHNDGAIHLDDQSSLAFSGMSMLTGNDVQLDPYYTGVSITGTFVNQTDLAGNIAINTATVYNDGAQFGAYVPDEFDWSNTSVSNSTIIGGSVDGYFDAYNTVLKNVVILPDTQFDGADVGFAGVIDNRIGVGTSSSGGPAQGYAYIGGAVSIVEDTAFVGQGFGQNFEVEQIVGNGDPFNPTTLTISPEASVSAYYEIGANDLIIVNQGVINDYYSNGEMFIDPAGGFGGPVPGIRNSGVIDTSAFADLYLFDAYIDNTDGVINAPYATFDDVRVDNGIFRGDPYIYGQVEFFGTRFESPDSPGGGGFQYFELDAADLYLQNVTFAAQTEFYGYDALNSFVTFSKDVKIEGNGSISLYGVSLDLGDDLTFDSTGTLAMDSVLIGGSGGLRTLTVGPQFTVQSSHSFGADYPEIGLDSLRIVNYGTITGDELVIDPVGDMTSPNPGLINRGTINGYTYIEDGFIDNEGGLIDGAQLTGVHVRGGTLKNVYLSPYANSQFAAYSEYYTTRLEDVTLEGSIDSDTDQEIILAGDIINNAYVSSSDFLTLVIDGSVRLSGTGTFDMENVDLIGNSEDDTLTNEVGHTLIVYGYDNVFGGPDSPQLINNGTIDFYSVTLFDAAYRSETLPIGAEVPDVSDPNNPDATMLLTEETTYQILRPIVNRGTLNFDDAGVLNSTVIDNAGGTITGYLEMNGSSILNTDGMLDNLVAYLYGQSVIAGGSADGLYLTVQSIGSPATISEIAMSGSDVAIFGPTQFGGRVDLSDFGYTEVSVGTPGQGLDAIIVNSDTSVVDLGDLDMDSGKINLSAGTLRAGTLAFTTPYDFLTWTGGTFGLTQQDINVTSAGLLGQTINLPAGFGLEAGQNLNIAADGQVNLTGGSLYAGTLNITSPTGLVWISGTLGLTTQDLDVTNGGTLGSTVALAGGFGLDVANAIHVGGDGVVIVNGGHLRAGTIDNTSGGFVQLFNGSLSVDQFMGDLLQTGGTLTPGQSPGVTTVTGNYTLTNGAIQLELGGLSQGAEYDVVVVQNNLTLSNAMLDILVLETLELAPDQWLDIISIGGVRSGLFNGLPDGSTFGTFGDIDLYITYTAGDGNDIAVYSMPELVALLGDANNDGVVSADDFAAVQTNFGNTGAADGLLPGDANDDGVVSADDFAAIQTNFGNVLAATAPTDAIPEPATLSLLAVGALIASRRRRR